VNSPLISIIMPFYNAEAYVRQAVDSVFEQDYPHWELLLVDDGSTDNSSSIVRGYEDERVKIFNQPNR